MPEPRSGAPDRQLDQRIALCGHQPYVTEDIMAKTTRTISQQWKKGTELAGVPTASLLVVMLAATIMGALVGLLLGGWLEPVLVAMIAGFLGTITAGIVRNSLLMDAWGTGANKDTGTPIVVVTYATVASLAGSLAADRIALLIGALPAVVTGGLAGLLSGVLLGLLMIVYQMIPDN
jgi:hypothetical protein